MRIFFLIVLVAVVLAQPDCIKTKCKKQYDDCTKNLGCAIKGQKCESDCKKEPVCEYNCCMNSGNPQLVALAECGKVNCETAETLCEEEYCTNEFFKFCQDASWQTIQVCWNEFFTMYPHCECVEKL